MERRRPMLVAAAASSLLHIAAAALLSRAASGAVGLTSAERTASETVILTDSAWSAKSPDESSSDPPAVAPPRPLTSRRESTYSRPQTAPPRLPVADPVDTHESTATAEASGERRHIVGLSLGSTVVGGGPAFAVGNTRMGSTAPTAAAPHEVAPLDAPMLARQRVSDRAHLLGRRHLPPRRQHEVSPRYPEPLRKQGVEADVLVAVVVDADGNVVEALVLKPSAYAPFNDEALAAARAQKWLPAMADGRAVGWRLQYHVRFRLEDS